MSRARERSREGRIFLLPDLRCRFSTAERREGAVAAGADRILCFLIEDTTEICIRHEL